ncbi:MAG: Gfo/Idh/MocA family oxidoreductase [Pirellulales bacterium]|nr:Gfo/Idh/MocA family oxidoreductase [Pirellulales bacterium]
MSEIRIGLIGAGANTRLRHIPGLQAISGVRLVCVANRSLASGQAIAGEYDIPRVHAHWTDVVADPGVDAVLIGTWPYLHAEATCRALEAGKHVLCEARMAMNAAQARRMLATAQQTGRVAMLVPSPFGLAGDRVMGDLIAAKLGELREIYVRALSPQLLDASLPLHWRQRADLSGVNVLTLGILNETVQRWFGRTESVMAETSIFVPRRLNQDTGRLDDVETPDSVAVVARMASGATCVYHVSGAARHAGGMRLEAYGAAGSVHYDLERDTIHLGTAEDKQLAVVPIPAEQAGRWQVEEDFIAAIRGERPVTMTNFADGVKYMCFTEAVRRSADTGRRVHLFEV